MEESEQDACSMFDFNEDELRNRFFGDVIDITLRDQNQWTKRQRFIHRCSYGNKFSMAIIYMGIISGIEFYAVTRFNVKSIRGQV